MADTPGMKFRLEPEYKDAMSQLVKKLKRKKMLRHPTCASLVRFLIDDAAQTHLGYSPNARVRERQDNEF